MGECVEGKEDANDHPVSAEKLAQAEQLKAAANAAFKGTTCQLDCFEVYTGVLQAADWSSGSADKQYAKAIATYTKAIEANPNSAVLFANRAAAHIRLESYGSGVADATTAIELDPDYIKVASRESVKNPAIPG